MSRVYRWRQTVIYTVTMLDVGEVDEETGEAMTAEQADASAKEWQQSAMPIEYYPEDFVTVDEGPVEYLGMTLAPAQPEEGCPHGNPPGSARDCACRGKR